MFAAFLEELKRRHLIRVAGVYAVAAWGVFQIAKTIFDTADLPKSMSMTTLLLLVLGLPVVLVVSWIVERKAKREAPAGDVEGSAEAPSGAAALKLSRVDMLMLALLVLVVGLAGAEVGGYVSGGRATILGVRAPDKSVAVLPFAVFDAHKDSDDFADGLTEEVINSLAQAPDLKVAGRTSAFYFKGKNEDLREVGKRLGVAHIVEGSVRREGDRLRVTAQLIKVSDGFQIWSKTYDRKLDDAFAIQSEIGRSVAEALQTKLALKGPAQAAKRDPAAYQLEITSRAHLRRRGLEDLQDARAGYEKLMTLEPQNAQAYAGFAQATITLAQNHLGMDFGGAQQAAEAALQKAVQLDPESSDVWLARATASRVLSIRIGGVRYERDFDQAVRKAVALDPRNSDALTLLAVRLSDTGKPAEALAAADKAVGADPLSRSALMAQAKALGRVGRLAESSNKYRAVIQLYPDFSEAGYQLAVSLVEQGRLDQAEPWLRAAAASGDDPFIAFQAAWIYNNLGLPKEAHTTLAAITASPGKELGIAGELADRGDWAGVAAYGRGLAAKSKDPFWPMVVFQGEAMLGHDAAAIEALKQVRPDLLGPDAQVAVTDINMPILLAHVLKRAGETAQAERLLDSVLAVTAPTAGARTPNDQRIARAKVFAERGQKDAAIAEVQGAYDAGWRAGYLADDALWLDQQPCMASVRDDPRLKAVMAKVRADLARQRAAVLAARVGSARAQNLPRDVKPTG